MKHARLSFVCAAIVCAAASASDRDWPCYLGPQHDNISREPGLKTAFDKPLKLIWDRKVGSAFSSFALVGNRAYTCGTADKKQVLFCLDADDGKIIWQTPIEQEYPEKQGGDGTRATPTVDDGRVYILGARGTLLCCDAKTGKPLWHHKYDAAPRWGYSGSVLIEGNLAIVSPGEKQGSLVALDKQSGKQVWAVGHDDTGYATPYPFDFDGKRYVAGFMGKLALIVELPGGREVCRIPWEQDNNVNAASPIVHKDLMFLGSAYGRGCAVYRLSRDGKGLKATQVWAKPVMQNKFQTPVFFDGHLYASDERGLKCVELESGKNVWTQRGVANGTVLLNQPDPKQPPHLFVLTEDGDLLIARATPDGFEPQTRAEILSDRCWSAPVLHNGRIYARNLDRLVCFSLE